ncbi:MAG: hypothetical protein AAB909_00520 [Patescibacteria group bacterium]
MAKKVTEKSNSKACEMCNCTCGGRWATFGWALLLLGGLAHMLPTQIAPLLAWNLWGVTLQMAVGVLSVILALYYLLGE